VPITPLKRSRVNESDDDEDGMDEDEDEEEEDDDFELDAYKDWLMAEGSKTGNTYILSLVH